MKKYKLYNKREANGFKELISISTRENKDNIAFAIKNNNNQKLISYYEFSNDVRALGSSFIASKFANKKIGLLAENKYEWCVSFMSITTSGNIAVPINTSVNEKVLKRIIIETNLDIIMFDKKYLNTIKKIIKENITNIKKLICIDFNNSEEKANNRILSYKKLLKDGIMMISDGYTKYTEFHQDVDSYSVISINVDYDYNINKIMLSQKNICSTIAAISERINFNKDNSLLISLPLDNITNIIFCFLYPFFSGTRLYFLKDPKNIDEELTKYKKTILVADYPVLGNLYSILLTKIVRFGRYLKYKLLYLIEKFLLLFRINISKKLSKQIFGANLLFGNLDKIIYINNTHPIKKEYKFFKSFGTHIINIVSLPEASGVLSTENDKNNTKINYTKPLFEDFLQIINKDDKKIGEITLNSPNLMLGYYNNPSKTNKVIKEGIFYSGILAKKNRKGFIKIKGKKDSLHKLSKKELRKLTKYNLYNFSSTASSELFIKNKEIETANLETIELLRQTVDAKDPYTRGHSERVSEFSVLIGKRLGLSPNDLTLLKIGGLFHDIGKIGIPDKILLKPDRLTDEEYEEIKKHPVIGEKILKASQKFNDILPIVRHHHERFDGYGYPDKLKGTSIPYLARIASVADTFDAMTSNRAYRKKLPIKEVIAEIKRCSGTQFDPTIANAFIYILTHHYKEILKIQNKYK